MIEYLHTRRHVVIRGRNEKYRLTPTGDLCIYYTNDIMYLHAKRVVLARCDRQIVLAVHYLTASGVEMLKTFRDYNGEYQWVTEATGVPLPKARKLYL